MNRRIDFLFWQADVFGEVDRIGHLRFGLSWEEIAHQRRPVMQLQARLRREAVLRERTLPHGRNP